MTLHPYGSSDNYDFRFLRPDQVPVYPNLGAKIAKMRAVKHPTREQRRAHGEAVLKAIRSLQRQELQRQFVGSNPNCASRTAHTTGKAILKAVRARHLSEMQAAINADRCRRSDATIKAQYEAAMKRTREVRAKAAKAEARAAAKATLGKLEEFLSLYSQAA